MVNYLLRLGAKILLAGLASGVMYCLWIDTVAPESQRIAQLFVLFEYAYYCLSLLLIFHISSPQRVVDTLFPPVIALAFAMYFWWVSEWLLIAAGVSMLVASSTLAWTGIVRKLVQHFLPLPKFSRKAWIGIGIITALAISITFIFFAGGFHGFPILFIILPPFMLAVYVSYCSIVFFYPAFLLWFFEVKRGWRAWLLLVFSTLLWVVALARTYPIDEWRMRTFVDPCYHESMGFDSADYQIVSGRVCVQPSGSEGPFNISTRKTLIGADAATFQQIGDSPYHRDSLHVYYGDKTLPVNLEDMVVSGKFLLSGGKLFEYGELVDIEKETKLFQPDDKSFELRYLDSAFTKKEGDFPKHTLSGNCETVRYIWDAFRFNYRYAVMTTGKGCLFQSGENEEFVGEKVISGVPGKLYQHQFDMIWLSESCGNTTYRVIYPRDWNEFFLPQLILQNRCQKK